MLQNFQIPRCLILFYKRNLPTEKYTKIQFFLNISQKLDRDSIVEDFSGKTMKALKIFSILIGYLKDSFLKTIHKRLYQFDLSESDIDFVLVVPARCGDGAKMFMREAAIIVR